MKKSIFLLYFIFSINFLFGQEETTAYKFFVGGGLSFNHISESDSDDKQNTFSISPYLGYSVSDNLIIGLGVTFFNTKTSVTNSESRLRSFSIGPFARYRKSVSKKMGLYGEFGLGYRSSQFESTPTGGQTEEDPKSNFFRVYLGPGIDFALSDRWVVNAGWGALSYVTESEEDEDNKINGFGLNLNPASIVFSLNYLF